MTDKRKRRALSSWRKTLLVNEGKSDSGTQSAVTLGYDIVAAAKEIDDENVVSQAYDGGVIFKDVD